jgi:hypothetical protein
VDPFWSPKGLQFVSKRPCWPPKGSIVDTTFWSPNGLLFASKRPCLSLQGFYFDHPNGSNLVTQGAPVCIHAAVLVTQGFHSDHPSGSISVTQGAPVWSPNGL